MIKLVKSVNHSELLDSIDCVPEEALPIIKKYEPLFDHDSVHAERGWFEFSDLPLEEAEKLKQELIEAGFECEIIDNPWSKSE